MNKLYQYDTRGASQTSQIINLENMIEERDSKIEQLQSELAAANVLINRYAQERAPEALVTVAKDRDKHFQRAERAEADLAAALATINDMEAGYDRAARMIVGLKADLAAARADATLLRSTLIDIAAVMGMSSLPSYSEWEKIRNKALQLVAALNDETRINNLPYPPKKDNT